MRGGPVKDTEQRDQRAALVDAASRLPESEREQFFQRACSQDPTLTEDMQELLEAAARGQKPFRRGDLVAGRFRVTREIAEGGMGVVYEALDEKLNVTRALKCAKLGYRSHLPPEARNALRVTHPNVCRIFEIHSAETHQGPIDFLSMELIEGPTLSSRLKNDGAFPEAEARRVALQICAGVEAAHAQNLLHRDLKSNNVLLAKDSQGGVRAVVTDFGLAQERSMIERGLAASGLVGTPEYLAPERWHGEPASIASDIFALGIVLHELVTGHRPKPDGANLKSARVPEPGVPARWRKVIERCLDPDPGKRYVSAAKVAEALEGKASRRRWLLVAAAVVLALVAASFWKIGRPAQTPPARLAILPLEERDADAQTAALVEGASYDLSNRLSRLRPRPSQLVVIPAEQTRGLKGADVSEAKGRLGATHVLRGIVTRSGNRLLLRGSLIDTSTKVAIRDMSGEYELSDSAALVPALAAMVAETFHLPRQNAVESVVPAAYADYARGMAALRGGSPSYASAVAAFERAIAIDPASALPRAGLAEACYNAWQSTQDPKWLTRGVEQLTEAEKRNPDSIAVRLATGKLSLAPGSYDRAVQQFQRAIQLDPTSSEAWRGLAQAYQAMQGRDNEAVAAYMKAIELQPGYFAPWNYLGTFYRLRGNYQEAEKCWRRVIELAPQLLAGHANLGALYGDLGRYDDAERELKQALEIDGQWRPALNNLGAVYAYRGQDEEALKYLERARALGSESDTLLLNIGDSSRRAGHSRQAAEAYQRGRQLAERSLLNNPSDAVARSFVAYFAARMGNRAEAERELTQALRFGGQQKTVIRRAVLTYEALGKRDRALEVLQSATSDVLQELNRQPDLAGLRQDPHFIALLTTKSN